MFPTPYETFRKGVFMTLRHFRIFIEVASAGSITQAARNLYLTQPTVSTAVRELEEHYGTLFFDRINQRLRITGEGRRFLDYARHFIQMYDEMELAFSNSGISGVLRIGASTNVGIPICHVSCSYFKRHIPGAHAGPYTDDRTDGSHALKWGARSCNRRRNHPLRTDCPDSPVSGTLHRHLRAGTPDGRKNRFHQYIYETTAALPRSR